MAGDGTAGDGRGRSDSSTLPVAPHAPRPPPSSGLPPPPPARVVTVLEAQAVEGQHSACSALRRLAEDLCYQASSAGGENGVQRKQSRGRTADSSRSRSGGGGSSPSATCQTMVVARSLAPVVVHPAADAVRSAMTSLEERWRQLVRELKGVAEAAAPPPPPPPSPTRDRRSRQQPTHKSNRDPGLEERDVLETRTRDQAAASQVMSYIGVQGILGIHYFLWWRRGCLQAVHTHLPLTCPPGTAFEGRTAVVLLRTGQQDQAEGLRVCQGG